MPCRKSPGGNPAFISVERAAQIEKPASRRFFSFRKPKELRVSF
jgi:hypothetical protein